VLILWNQLSVFLRKYGTQNYNECNIVHTIHWSMMFTSCCQGFNHVFKVGGPIPWSRVLLPFYRKKLDRSTQFGAVGYIITLYSSKTYVKSWVGWLVESLTSHLTHYGVRPNFVEVRTPRPPSGCWYFIVSYVWRASNVMHCLKLYLCCTWMNECVIEWVNEWTVLVELLVKVTDYFTSYLKSN